MQKCYCSSCREKSSFSVLSSVNLRVLNKVCFSLVGCASMKSCSEGAVCIEVIWIYYHRLYNFYVRPVNICCTSNQSQMSWLSLSFSVRIKCGEGWGKHIKLLWPDNHITYSIL
jgi:hypothetical protein